MKENIKRRSKLPVEVNENEFIELKKKYWILVITLLIIPLAALWDAIYIGIKSYQAYILTCLFEVFIFWCGVGFGESLSQKVK